LQEVLVHLDQFRGMTPTEVKNLCQMSLAATRMLDARDDKALKLLKHQEAVGKTRRGSRKILRDQDQGEQAQEPEVEQQQEDTQEFALLTNLAQQEAFEESTALTEPETVAQPGPTCQRGPEQGHEAIPEFSNVAQPVSPTRQRGHEQGHEAIPEFSNVAQPAVSPTRQQGQEEPRDTAAPAPRETTADSATASTGPQPLAPAGFLTPTSRLSDPTPVVFVAHGEGLALMVGGTEPGEPAWLYPEGRDKDPFAGYCV
jgi:hypothetical protein